jgi:hypothetical protein
MDLNIFLRDFIAGINNWLYDLTLTVYNWLVSIGLVK